MARMIDNGNDEIESTTGLVSMGDLLPGSPLCGSFRMRKFLVVSIRAEWFWPTSAKSSMVCFSKRFEIIGRGYNRGRVGSLSEGLWFLNTRTEGHEMRRPG